MHPSKWLLLLVSVVAATLLGGCDSIPKVQASKAAALFPVRVSANGRHLEDASGKPFLLHGDTAWSLMVQLSREETEAYLENRRQKGFNAILVNLIEHHHADHPPRNKQGDAPFTRAGDFSAPNEAYFAHADWLIQRAAEKGILVILNPCYTGYSSNFKSSVDGWTREILANGIAKCRDYGRYVGSRFKRHANIIWQAGGDTTIPADSSLEKHWLEILHGIKEHAPAHHWTAHWRRFSTALDQTTFAPYMDVDNAYGGNRSYVHTLRAYNRANPKPTFFNEGYYEETNIGAGAVGTPQQMRAQAYWALLSGATGHIFGSDHIWAFGGPLGFPGKPLPGKDWRKGMDRQPSREMVFVKRLFEGRAWHDLGPHQDHSLVTKGYGTFGKDDRTVGGDYVTAARTSDGRLVMAYVPSTGIGTRTIAVDMSRLSGPVHARWYNPTSGTFAEINGSPLASSGSREFATPGDNGTGANDWVLVLEAAASPPRNRARAAAPAQPVSVPKKAVGPLRVHPTNPRYFSDGSGKAVYLTGSHHWDNFQRWFEGEAHEGMKAGHPGRFAEYLDVLEKHQHNLVRLWVGDTAWSPITKAPIEPQPYVRTGPDRATDGGLKFDLARLNQAYFDELRARVIAARERGIYVSVMLFNSWGISRYHNIPPSTVTWPYHPFNQRNNINGIDGDPNGDDLGLEYHTMQIPAITRLQETYVRKVVDTVGDLDNVLFEISNESHGSSKDWQYHLTRFIKEYQAAQPKQHLVTMTGFTVPTAALFAGPAEIVAPNYSKANAFPAATGAKVVIIDSDHNGPYRRDPGFAWSVFLRGAHPIVMDWWSGPEWEDIRRALGQTRTYAERMDLAAMTPQDGLSSTAYCLANPGKEYLIYLPDGGEATVDLGSAEASLAVEWFNPRTGEKRAGDTVDGGAKRPFKAPFEGEAVLYLRAKRVPGRIPK